VTFLGICGAVLEFRKVSVQILINGGVESNLTNQTLNLG